MQAPITGVLDSEGYLCTPDNSNTVGGLTRGVKLFATDVGQVTGWTYTVKYSFTPVGTIVPSIPEHPLSVPNQSTRDLSKIAPTPPAPVMGIPQIEATALRAEEAALESATSSQESAQSAQQALTSAQAAQASAEIMEVANDQSMTLVASDPDSEFSTHLSAAFVGSAGASIQHPAFSFMRALHTGSADLTWLHVGDSTSRGTKPWSRTVLDLLGQDYPKFTTKYVAPLDADPLVYQAPETRQTGTGSRTLTLYNASRSGKSSLYAQGANWDILVAPVTPDLITVSHGHNDPVTREFYRSQYTALVESLKMTYPYAEVVLIAQNPETNNSNMEVRAQEVARLARQRGYGFVNIHDLFALRPGGYADLMLDTVHPTEAGHDLTAAEVKKVLTWNPAATPLTSGPSSLVQSTENLSPEGAFIGWDGTGIPAGFTTSGPVTLSKDTTNFETKGYAVKVTASGASGILQYDLPVSRVPLVKGQEITLAVRMFVPTGQPGGAGRIGFRGDVQLVGNASTEGQGRFRWAVFTGRVTANPAVVRLMIYAADSGGVSGGEITIDRIITCRGTLPRDYFTTG